MLLFEKAVHKYITFNLATKSKSTRKGYKVLSLKIKVTRDE